MISVIIGAILAVLLAGLTLVRVRYGHLRASELPVLLWCVLAGGEHRRQLRVILGRRERARCAACGGLLGPEFYRSTMSGAGYCPACHACGWAHSWARLCYEGVPEDEICDPCHHHDTPALPASHCPATPRMY